MNGVFIYDINRCVSCLACVAGCRLANHYSVPWRTVLNDNPAGYPALPVNNLSLACNHCENPSCMTACPAAAYTQDKDTGAVILDEKKCIGCNYCYWSCPFDAPRYSKKLGNVQKCHFCHERISAGDEPACSSACPTGALRFDRGEPGNLTYGIIADTDLAPRVTFIKPRDVDATVKNRSDRVGNDVKSKVLINSEWSLIVFTYLSSLMFAFSFSILSGGVVPTAYQLFSLLVICIILPLLHLGHPVRAWRAVMNIGQSSLSVEILLLLLFVIITTAGYITGNRLIQAAGFISGLLLMVAIDNVYTSADRRLAFRFHPGQIFLTGLLFASLFGIESRALLFIVLLKLFLNNRVRFFVLRTKINMAIALVYNLVILTAVILLFTIGRTWTTVSMFLLAELLNRVGYYMDFKPPGITNEYLQRGEYNEKKKRD